MSSTTAPTTVCVHCQAKNPADARQCWLCGRSPAGDASSAAVHDREPQKALPPGNGGWPWQRTYALNSLLLVMTLASLGLGIFVRWPGLAILLGIVSLPALIRTALVVNRRSELGVPVTTGSKVLLFLGSAVTTTIVAVVVLVAAVGSFCTVCLTAGTEAAVPAALLVAAVVTGLVVWGCSSVIRARWRRHTRG